MVVLDFLGTSTQHIFFVVSSNVLVSGSSGHVMTSGVLAVVVSPSSFPLALLSLFVSLALFLKIFVVLWLSPSFVSVPSLLSFFSVFSVPFYLSWFWTVTLLLLALRHDLLFVTLYILNKQGFRYMWGAECWLHALHI